MQSKNVHGGDLDEISREYGIEKSSILNFSGNVNPLGLPLSVKKAIAENVELAEGYPDVSYVALRAAIAEYTGADAENIVTGNGSTELITAVIKAVMPKKAVLISPAYSEYLRVLDSIGCETKLSPLSEENDFMPDISALPITDETDMLVICNPNNPTGSYLTADETEEIVKRCKALGCFVMTDETYVEFSDPQKRISAVELTKKYDNIAVIRGTSKFFACPGLRLGYAVIGSRDIVGRDIVGSVNAAKDLWSVNVFAELAGCVMFTDRGFINATTELINTERQRFIDELGSIEGLKLYPTQSNFFLAEILGELTSREVFLALIKKNILIRDAKDFPFLNEKFIRFCILSHEENTLLIEALKELLNIDF